MEIFVCRILKLMETARLNTGSDETSNRKNASNFFKANEGVQIFSSMLHTDDNRNHHNLH